jgi:hypothetical protein
MVMSEFNKKRLLELLNSMKPEVIYCNPSDRAIIDEALKKANTTHIFEVRESEAIEKGKLVRINKKEFEKYLFTPPIQFDTDPGSATCNNCKYQPDIFEMCNYGKNQTSVMRKCPRWEKRCH